MSYDGPDGCCIPEPVMQPIHQGWIASTPSSHPYRLAVVGRTEEETRRLFVAELLSDHSSGDYISTMSVELEARGITLCRAHAKQYGDACWAHVDPVYSGECDPLSEWIGGLGQTVRCAQGHLR